MADNNGNNAFEKLSTQNDEFTILGMHARVVNDQTWN